MKKLALLLIFAFYLLPSAQAQAPRAMNAAEIKLALNKLGKLCSVLYVGAHPDDENTAVLAYLANEMQCRTGYLSLTRGEGGQNLIGSEKGAALGVIRTQELLAARRIDGAEQFFSRAIDFGFSKTADESFQKWGKQEVLADVVWTIRKFRPDVVIARFPPDARAGHGHHQASAILAAEAFKLAGDARAFPEQLKYVAAWQPKRLVWNAFVREGDAPAPDWIKIDVGKFNPLLGKSYTEIAAESRNQHKSQGQGSSPARGSKIEYFAPVDGEQAQNDLLDGVETSWKRIEGGEKVGEFLKQIQTSFQLEKPSASLPLLIQTWQIMQDLSASFPITPMSGEQGKSRQISPLSSNLSLNLQVKLLLIRKLIENLSGLKIEAIADTSTLSPRISTNVTLSMTSRVLTDVNFSNSSLLYLNPQMSSEFYTEIIGKERESVSAKLELNQTKTVQLNFKIDDAVESQPFWLRNSSELRTKQTATQTPTDLSLSHVAAENPTPIVCQVNVYLENKLFTFVVPVQYRYVDKVRGEVYQPLVIAPRAVVNLAEGLQVFPTAAAKQIRLTIRNNGAQPLAGTVKLDLPAGWQVSPKEIPVNLIEKGAETTVTFAVAPTANAQDGTLTAFVEAGGERYDKQQLTIDYPHIPQQTLFPDATAKLVRLDVKTAATRIGYIAGSGDDVPAALLQLGYTVKMLSDEDLATLDLSANFDTIIAGIRAYNTRAALKKQNPRVLEFVKNGGKFIVQYNVNDQTLMPNFAPFPLKLTSDRVTIEEAPVKFLAPDNAILNAPNKITQKDFENWVQERGTYFAGEYDKQNFTPILEMHDPNEPERTGSLLVANYGKGKFVYSGLAFFRQLPAGVPGAYRLFVNLVSKEGN